MGTKMDQTARLIAVGLAGVFLTLAGLLLRFGEERPHLSQVRRFAHPNTAEPLTVDHRGDLEAERRLLLIEPAWRIRVVEVPDLPDLALVEYDASLWQATIFLRVGLLPEQRAYLIRHELLELALWEYGEWVAALIEAFVPPSERAFWHRQHMNIRNRIVERFIQIIAQAEDRTRRQRTDAAWLQPPAHEERHDRRSDHAATDSEPEES